MVDSVCILFKCCGISFAYTDVKFRVDVCDRPYGQLTVAARAVGETMYETRFGKEKP